MIIVERRINLYIYGVREHFLRHSPDCLSYFLSGPRIILNPVDKYLQSAVPMVTNFNRVDRGAALGAKINNAHGQLP